jgi:trehalose 6-phosphate phosphatase
LKEETIVSTAAVRVESGAFFPQLGVAWQRLLILDYDGTIAPFSVDRGQALPYAPVPEMLARIMRTCRTRLVLISGRTAREVVELLGLSPRPEVWGVHGLERLYPDGRREIAPLPEEAVRGLAEADALLESEGLDKYCELKAGATAVHWRGLQGAALEDVRAKAYRLLAPVACEANLLLTEFDGGLELRARACNKGHAVRTLLAECAPGIPVAYLGDDQTDEDAFAAVNGHGLSVLVRPEYRETSAQMWLKPPTELLKFLNDWIRACGGKL